MFLERRTGVKMDLSLCNIRVNVKVTEFPLSNHSSNPPPPFFFKGGDGLSQNWPTWGRFNFFLIWGEIEKRGGMV